MKTVFPLVGRVLILNAAPVAPGLPMCLKSVPKHCPPGDERGKVYTVTNLRTHQSFSLSDSPHECGGA